LQEFGIATMNAFNAELNHIRFMWGIPKGATLIIWIGNCNWIGNPYSCSAHCAMPMNDNEAVK